jgi:hypothetical protein
MRANCRFPSFFDDLTQISREGLGWLRMQLRGSFDPTEEPIAKAIGDEEAPNGKYGFKAM